MINSMEVKKNTGFKFDMNNLTKVFIGTSNWDIYADSKGTLYSVAKPERRGTNGANMDTHFGDRNHIRRLMDKGYFDSTPTEAGLELMCGLHSVKYTPENSKPFVMLKF